MSMVSQMEEFTKVSGAFRSELSRVSIKVLASAFYSFFFFWLLVKYHFIQQKTFRILMNHHALFMLFQVNNSENSQFDFHLTLVQVLCFVPYPGVKL